MKNSFFLTLNADEYSALINRIISLRCDYLHINQAAFSSSLNISQSYLSLIESQKKQLTNDLIDMIVFKYNVNSKWLLSGIGTPFKKAKSGSSDPFLNWYNSLPADAKRRFVKMIKENFSFGSDYPF